MKQCDLIDICVQMLYNRFVQRLYTQGGRRMSTVTFRVTDDEKAFIQSMAELNGLSLSELARTKLLESLEDQIDINLYEKAMKAHKVKDESISHQEMLRELDL